MAENGTGSFYLLLWIYRALQTFARSPSWIYIAGLKASNISTFDKNDKFFFSFLTINKKYPK